MTTDRYILWSPVDAKDGSRPLPVKIRNADYEVIAEGLTGQSIPVEAGSYWVTALLPDGREIGPQDRLEALPDLRASDAETGPAGVDERGLMDVLPMADAAPDSAHAFEAARTSFPFPIVPSEALLWRGDWWSLWDEKQPALRVARQDMEFPKPLVLPAATDMDQMLAFADPNSTEQRFSVVPYDLCLSCGPDEASAGILASLDPKEASPSILFRSAQSEEANILFEFMEAGTVSDMRSLSSDLLKTKQALKQSGTSVLRAIAAAYVLLRSNNLDGLDEWIADLHAQNAVLPDINALQVELFARLGRHEEAAAALRQVVSSRCPWFRSGISYVRHRLQTYLALTDPGKNRLNLGEEDRKLLKKASSRLEKAVNHIVTDRHIATFNFSIKD